MNEMIKFQINRYKAAIPGPSIYSTPNNISFQPFPSDKIDSQYKWFENGADNSTKADYYPNVNQALSLSSISRIRLPAESYSNRQSYEHYQIPQQMDLNNDDVFANTGTTVGRLNYENGYSYNYPNISLDPVNSAPDFQAFHYPESFNTSDVSSYNLVDGKFIGNSNANENDSVSMSGITESDGCDDTDGFYYTLETEISTEAHMSHINHSTKNQFFKQETRQQTQSDKRKRKRVLNRIQRAEATMREKRRMFKLNKAFEDLRKVLPLSGFAKNKLSRAETLKSAIDYIDRMTEVLLT
jgi:hypothetical protein